MKRRNISNRPVSMEKKPFISLTWNGHATATSIPELIDMAERIEIVLPANYNHALFRALNPQAPDSAVEDLDITAGPELLTEVAAVSGLEDFSILIDVLNAAQASLRLTSPPALMIDLTDHH